MSWHGDADTTVTAANQDSVVAQWTALHGTDTVADNVDTIAGYETKEYVEGGRVVVKTVRVPALRHAVAIDPGALPDVAGDEANPTVTFSFPTEEYAVPSVMGGLIKLRGSAWDDVAIDRVELRVSQYAMGYAGTPTQVMTVGALTTLPDSTGTAEWIYALDSALLESFKYYLIEAVAFDKAGKESDVGSVRLMVNSYMGSSSFSWVPASVLP